MTTDGSTTGYRCSFCNSTVTAHETTCPYCGGALTDDTRITDRVAVERRTGLNGFLVDAEPARTTGLREKPADE